ncbi:SEL1-like repeat protein [Nocardia heshunensis]
MSESGGMIYLIGSSAAGKTRAAYEALRAVLPDHRIATPATGVDLPVMLDAIVRFSGGCVLWLDDLEKFLGPGALDPNTLRVLLQRGVSVVGTIRKAQFELFDPGRRPGSGLGDDRSLAQLAHVGAQVLSMCESIELPRIWSDDELGRAAALDDERISEAVECHGYYGVAEYLAAGPAIWSEWRRAADVEGQPRGAALVSAAVDLARSGLPGPYPQSLIVDLHAKYLEQQGGMLLRPESLNDAFAWASRTRFGVASPLLPFEGERWLAFPYLADRTDELSTGMPIRDFVWGRAAECAETDIDSMSVAVRAAEAATAVSLRVAEEIWQTRISSSSAPIATMAAYNLGVLLMETERPEAARSMFLQAAENGEPRAAFNLSVLLVLPEEAAEAREWCRIAAEAGYPDACFDLGFKFEADGQLAEAEHWYRRGADLGEYRSATNLGNILTSAGRTDEAHSWYAKADSLGDSRATFNIGLFHHEAGRFSEAEHWYLLAFERGSAEAALNLGVLWSENGDLVAAEKWFRLAADKGRAGAMFNLGNLLASSGRLEEARACYLRGADSNHLESIRALGRSLYDAERPDEAVVWFERAAALGDRLAAAVLGGLLTELGRIDDAIAPLTVAADGGHIDSAFNLAVIYRNRGDVGNAQRWYREAADGGDAEGAVGLAGVLFENGRVASAIWWIGRARKLRANHSGPQPV